MDGGSAEKDENGLKSNLLPRGREIRGDKLTVSARPESPLQRLKVTGLKLGSWMDGYVPLPEVEVTEPRMFLEWTRGMSRM